MKDLIDTVIAVMRADAHDRNYNAGMSGSMHDGGAREINQLADAIEFGKNGITSNDILKSYIVKARAELQKAEAMKDPDWAQYVRLRKKFQNVEGI
jgi:hypothetical protein